MLYWLIDRVARFRGYHCGRCFVTMTRAAHELQHELGTPRQEPQAPDLAPFAQGPAPRDRPAMNDPALRTYGGRGTIHGSAMLDVVTGDDGRICEVWFRCQPLPFRQVEKGSAGELRIRVAGLPRIHAMVFHVDGPETFAAERPKELG